MSLRYFFVILSISNLLNLSYCQTIPDISKPDYSYLIKKTRVFPDTSLLQIDYYNKNDKVVYREEIKNEVIYSTEEYVYNNDTLKEFYRRYPTNTSEPVTKNIYKYVNDSVILFSFYYEYIDCIRIVTNFTPSERVINYDNLYDNINVDSTTNIFNEYLNIVESEKSRKYWSFITIYDKYGREVEWKEVKDDGKSFSTFYKYQKKSDTIPVKTWTNYPVSTTTKQDFKAKTNTIITRDNSDIIEKRIEYFDNDFFKYKELVYGSSFRDCTTGNYKVSDKITETPNQEIVYEKYYR